VTENKLEVVPEPGNPTIGARAGSAVAKKPDDLVITRLFDAPRRLVFEAWSSAEHVSRWFAPRPLTMPRCEVDFRPGGAFRFVMRAPDGTEYPFEGVFREIVVPERIVFTGVIHEGNAAVTTVTFTERDGKTTLTAHQTYTFESSATRGAKQGWTLTLDQLGEHLASS
jgi:uncharacterized protein YndB with AHSA1/START domain